MTEIQKVKKIQLMWIFNKYILSIKEGQVKKYKCCKYLEKIKIAQFFLK